MKKHRTILCCLFLILWGGCSQSSDNPEASQPNNDLAELLQKVKATLPQGWAAKLSPNNKQLIIALKKKSSVEYRSIGAFRLLKHANEPIEISLIQVPFITVDEYENQKNNNQLGRQKRIDFEEKHLSHLFGSVGRKDMRRKGFPAPPGYDPSAPGMYNPQTAKDKQAVTEYKALWNNTEPEELPTHRFKNVSLQIKDYPIFNADGSLVYIVDEHITKQHNAILVSLNELLSEY